MVTLQVNPTFIRVVGADPLLNKQIGDAFSWEDKSAYWMVKRHKEKVHRSPMKWCHVCQTGTTKCLYLNNCLPIGFQERLLDLLGEWGVTSNTEDCRPPKPVRQFDWTCDFELRPYQQDIVDAVLSNQYGVIEAATGAGKSLVAAAVVAELGVPALLLTPTKVVFGQFWELFTSKTNIPVGQLGSGKYEDAPVQIAIAKSLINGDGTSKHEYLHGKQLLLIDEWHQGASKTWGTIITDCPAYYRFGFSATPFRATDLECNMLTGMCGEVIAEIGTEELQAEGFLCATDIRMIRMPCEYDRNVYDETIPEGKDEPIGWRETTYAERYRQAIVENFDRNLAISEVVNHHYERGDKVLVIVSWTDHADMMLSLLPDDTIYLSGKDTQKKTKQKTDEYKGRAGGVLLGSPVVDVGFDVPACDVVVMAGGGSYDGRQRQRLGRGLRPSPGKESVVIVDFIDHDPAGGRPMFYQHSKARMQAYRDVGQEVREYADVGAALGEELKLEA